MEITRELATIREISAIEEHGDADALEIAVIDGWKTVVKRGEFKPGDRCVYFEIDSLLPVKEEYEFLRRSCYNKRLDGFRIRTAKIRGRISQGLALPVPDEYQLLPVGSDLTDELGVTKYEKEPWRAPGHPNAPRESNWPSFIEKTDEPRVQNCVKLLRIYAGDSFYVTEKLDGSSATYFKKDGVLHVCSRNREIEEDDGSPYWEMAHKYSMHENLPEGYVFQGEIVGPKMNGNRLGMKDRDLYIFTVLNIEDGKRLWLVPSEIIATGCGLNFVPIIDCDYELPWNAFEIIDYATGKSELNPEKEREGVVLRKFDNPSVSFKAISNTYLLAED